MEKKSNKKVLSIVIVLVLLMVILGISYAIWNYGFVGNENTISSEDISIEYLESTDVIALDNALPMSDGEGKLQEETFDFEVTTKTSRNMNISYNLVIETLEVDDGYNTLSDSDIKVYLEDFNKNILVNPIKINNLDKKILYSDVNNHDKENKEQKDKYKLRVWIDKNVDASKWDMETKLQYKFKIGVQTEGKEIYKVIFNSGYEEETTKEQVMYKDEQIALSENTFERKGYKLVGWSEEKDGEVLYSDKEAVTNIAGNKSSITLYGVWKKKEVEVTISEIVNGEIVSEIRQLADTQSYSIKYGEGIAFDTKPNSPIEGFSTAVIECNGGLEGTFKKGNVENNTRIDTIEIRNNTDSEEEAECRIIYTSVTYKVNYNSNGGTGDMTSTNHTYDIETKLSKNTFEKEGYTFIGWSTNKDSKEVEFTDEDDARKIKVNEENETTLYAVWEANSYTVAYTMNGATSKSNQTFTYDTAYNIPNPSKTFTINITNSASGTLSATSASKAQEFAGWTADSNLSTSTAMYGTSSTTVTTAWSNASTKVKGTYFKNLRTTSGTVTLTANWTPVDITLPTVTKTGYACGYTEANGETTITYASGGSYTPSATTGSVTLYTVCVDDIKPTCEISGNPSDWVQSANLTVKGDDKGSGINASPYSWTNSTSGFSTTATKSVTANGTYTAYVKDVAGNVGSCSVSVTKIDRTAPTCSIAITPSGEVPEKTLTISSVATDLASSPYSWTSETTGFSTTTTKVVSENGTYNGWVKDIAGNVGTCSATVLDIVPGPNEPVLSANMIPVYYDSTAGVWKKADSTNGSATYKWYDYNAKKWANSVTVTSTNRTTYKNASAGTTIPMSDILTMQVWIPRYKYKVWNYNADGTVSSDPQEIEITWEKGTESNGEITCTDLEKMGTSNGTATGTQPTTSEVCKYNNTTCTNDICKDKTYTHPAFTFGTKELTGFWVGKFEVSSDITTCAPADSSAIDAGCNLKAIRPLVKPNLTSWKGAMVGTFENNMMAMNDSSNKYGFATTDDTHMIKNMEWGAIAYLSHSKYGINKEIAINSANTYTTGCGPQEEGSDSNSSLCNSYNTVLGQFSSTTGNIYGVYDMSGGSQEYAMGNIVSPNGTTMMSGYRGSINDYSGYTGMVYYGSSSGDYVSYTGGYTYPEEKYYNKYSFNTSNSTRGRSKLGDAIKEVFNGSYGWYSGYSNLASSNIPWIYRGGGYFNGSNASIFYSSNTYGYANIYVSSRLVISQ